MLLSDFKEINRSTDLTRKHELILLKMFFIYFLKRIKIQYFQTKVTEYLKSIKLNC